jgi:hypothetical protein
MTYLIDMVHLRRNDLFNRRDMIEKKNNLLYALYT